MESNKNCMNSHLKVERKGHVQLYQTALSGDWDTAEGIYEVFPDEVNARITKRGETALHIAALAEHTRFVKQLLRKMSVEALTYKNNAGNTAFCFAAISGVEELAKVMMEMGSDLAMTRDRGNMLPIYMAALLGHRKMVSYLHDEMNEHLTDGDRIPLLVTLISVTYMFFVGTIRLKHLSPLAWKGSLALVTSYKLAQMKKLMHKQALDLIQYLWEQLVFLDDATISRRIGESWPLIFNAAERGNLDFLTLLIRLYPDLIFKVEHNMYSIFHIAILNRHEDIFKMIYQMGSIENSIATYKDREGNNMLHLAAKVLESPSRLWSLFPSTKYI